MFLTKFELNPRRRGAQQLIASPHAMHAAVLAGFAGGDAGAAHTTEQGRVLWRLERGEHRWTLLLLSPNTPDLTHLVEQAGWPTTETWHTKPYGQFLGRVANGDRYAFRLRANPVHSLAPEPGEKRGRVLAHVTPAQQAAWLDGQSEKHGFSIPRAPDHEPLLRVSDRATVSFQRNQKRVTLRQATFDGSLTVTDRDAFSAALTHGIGRAKGYGCGLLTLARER